MRDYSKVSPQFWIGKTGKKLRAAGFESQIVGMYLLTCPHANMLGLYYVSITSIAHETGLGIEGAMKGLQGCFEGEFCAYDHDSEVVWVYEMAAYQIADELDIKDNRCKGVQNEYNALPENPYLARFFGKYGDKFHMVKQRGISDQNRSNNEAPYKPLRSQEQEQEQEQKAGTGTGSMPADSGEPQKKGTRLPENWVLPSKWGQWALENTNLTESQIRLEADKFRDHWHANANQRNGKKSDWLAAWRNWIRNAKPGQQTKTQQVRANNERAVDEFVGGGDQVIEGEVVND